MSIHFFYAHDEEELQTLNYSPRWLEYHILQQMMKRWLLISFHCFLPKKISQLKQYIFRHAEYLTVAQKSSPMIAPYLSAMEQRFKDRVCAYEYYRWVVESD